MTFTQTLKVEIPQCFCEEGFFVKSIMQSSRQVACCLNIDQFARLHHRSWSKKVTTTPILSIHAAPQRRQYAVSSILHASSPVSASTSSASSLLNRRSPIEFWNSYKQSKEALNASGTSSQSSINTKAVFANNELNLELIDVYGFDFDYTLAVYQDELYQFIYELAKDFLVQNNRYPRGISAMPYDPSFAVRGLHFDVGRGLLMKIDSFHNIQLGSVYRGLHKVSDDEVLKAYDGTHVPLDPTPAFMAYAGASGGVGNVPTLVHLLDHFAPSETMMLANVIEYFTQNQISFDPEYVYSDVRAALQEVKATGVIHREITSNTSKFLKHDAELKPFLSRLTNNGKKLFLITNSSYSFIEPSLSYMLGSDWRQLFDVIVTQARKPRFFHGTTRAFRQYSERTKALTWDRVHQFDKGHVYVEGNMLQFLAMTKFIGYRTLYFGDHVYIDMLDPTLKYGWRTGAIIPELEREIATQSSTQYWRAITWLTTLENLIEELQEAEQTSEKTRLLRDWCEERDALRYSLKAMFNPQFGSMFRTHHNPTYFSRRLARFADVYTSQLTNLNQYTLEHTFFPHRSALPHEWQVTSLKDTGRKFGRNSSGGSDSFVQQQSQNASASSQQQQPVLDDFRRRGGSSMDIMTGFRRRTPGSPPDSTSTSDNI